MTNHPDQHRRRSIRLPDYDYTTTGAYFVTICAHEHRCLFGDVMDGRVRLNEAGMVVQAVWDELPVHYPHVEIDTFVVMPNHVHGIIILTDSPVGAAPRGRPNNCGQARGPAPTMSLPDVVHRFKTMTTKRYTDGVKQSKWPPFDKHLWQRGYYEHVVRRTDKMNCIREYILQNPLCWEFDRENPHLDKSGGPL
ncbi:MAG TPA: transposase [archaeon]|nr:transposase [archaeon]